MPLTDANEIDFKTPPRKGASPEALADIFRAAATGKPDGRRLEASRPADQKERGMYAIGG